MRKGLRPIALFAVLLLGLAGTVLAAGERDLLVKAAVLYGSRTAQPPADPKALFGQEELLGQLLAWDPDRDNRELEQLLALSGLEEIARQAAILPAEGGKLATSVRLGERLVDVSFDIRPDDDQVNLRTVVSEGGEVLSAPTVRTLLGERAIVMSGLGGPGGASEILFIAVEVGRATLPETVGAGAHEPPVDHAIPVVDGQDLPNPRPVHQVPPEYPEGARQAKIEGKVGARVLIDEQGRVEEVEVLHGLSHGLTEAAVDALRQWRFEPTSIDGRPSAVYYNLTVTFRLDE